MANTTNFGWETPDDTDLVKDGAAAIRTLGSAIDTSLVDLKGGTTNQVLAKNSNTDMDFKWVADATGIPATIFDAKGDIIAATAADTADRLAVGTNGHVLTADSTTATGLKWAAVSTPSSSYSLLNAGGTSLTGAATVTVSGISSMNSLYVLLVGASSASANSQIRIRFNTDTSSKYSVFGWDASDSTYPSSYSTGLDGDTSYYIGRMGNNASNVVTGAAIVTGTNSTGLKIISSVGSGTGTTNRTVTATGLYSGSSAITSVSAFSDTGNFDAGTIYVYGSAV